MGPRIVDRLLAKKPEDRFQSAREVADTLEHLGVAQIFIRDTSAVCPKKKAAQAWKTLAMGTAAGLATLLLSSCLLCFSSCRGPTSRILPPAHLYRGNSGSLWSLAVSSDGKKMAMGTGDGTVKFWDLAGDRVDWTLPAHRGTIWALALSAQHLATGGDDGPAKLWNLHTREEGRELADSAGTRSLAFDAEGKRLLTGGRKGEVRIWDVATGTVTVRPSGHTNLVGAVAFARDGKTMASASDDKTVQVWDADSGKEKVTLRGHQAGIYGIAFSPNGRMLVSGRLGQDRASLGPRLRQPHRHVAGAHPGRVVGGLQPEWGPGRRHG